MTHDSLQSSRLRTHLPGHGRMHNRWPLRAALAHMHRAKCTFRRVAVSVRASASCAIRDVLTRRVYVDQNQTVRSHRTGMYNRMQMATICGNCVAA